MSLRLTLLRHGETESGGGLRGSIDDLLTEPGWDQMRGAVANHGGWQRVISSPLHRCADFAAELAAARQLTLELQDGLRELHFGEWEGRQTSDLMRDQAEALGEFWRDPYLFTPPGGERLVDFEERVLSTLNSLALRYAGQHLLLVTHGGVMRLLLARARGLARQDLLQVEVGHGQCVDLLLDSVGHLQES